ncbi:unnamed protein product [Phytomonas sp. EM1]|nr:unnamed protein product [Phytomonas sp. EM1]|eukprot:CCW63807.1 unnamed protein product [Phytomonas sp. isolate EM1]
METRAFAQASEKTGSGAPTPDALTEEVMEEDTFPHRYLHPAATFSFAVAPGLRWFDPARMRLDREVEGVENFHGLALSPRDLQDLRLFDLAMRNGARDLLHRGGDAIRRVAQGGLGCFLAYQYTLYPARGAVQHHLPRATLSIQKLPRPSSGAEADREAVGGGNEEGARFVVTLHGVMTWRFPSMRGGGGAARRRGRPQRRLRAPAAAAAECRVGAPPWAPTRRPRG